MRALALLAFAAFSLGTSAFAQVIGPPDSFQVRYASNLNKGDSYINITNTGSNHIENPPGTNCIDVYTFDPSEEMVSCCSCVVTPNALVSLSVQGDLISNTLSPATPANVVIKIVAKNPPGTGTCDPASSAGELVSGIRAWGTTLHALPDGTYGVTETTFLPGSLSAAEFAHLTSFCGFINSNGSGFGICKSCRAGGLGGVKQ